MAAYSEEQAAIDARKKIAEMMLEQGQQPLETNQTAGGYVVPVSPMAGIGKVIQSLAGGYIGRKADEQSSALQDKKLADLAGIDINSSDAANQLLKNGMPKEAISLMIANKKASAGGTDGNFVFPVTSTGIGKGNKKTGDFSLLVDGNNKPYLAPNTDASMQGTVQAAKSGNMVTKTTDANGNEIVDFNKNLNPAIMANQPNNNVGNIRPQGSSTGFQQFATPQEGLSAIDKNLQAYGSEHGINTLEGVINRWSPPSENDTAALIKSASQRLGIDPKQPIDLNDPVQRHVISGAIALQESPVFKKNLGQSPAQKEASLLPIKKQEEQQKAEVSLKSKQDETKQAEEIGAWKTQDTLGLTYKYLYPDGIPVRDKNGRLTKPDTQMILGNTPGDRLENALHAGLGTDSQKAVNTNAFKRDIRTIVLDKLGGKLGNQISDADREFILSQVSDIEKAQNINDAYESVAAIEDRVKMVQSKHGNVEQAPKTEASPSEEDIAHTAKIHGMTVEQVKAKLGIK
jgi:hypothetical protein